MADRRWIDLALAGKAEALTEAHHQDTGDLPLHTATLEELLGRPAWMREAACTGRTDEMFAAAPEAVAAALAICAGCPVVRPCRDHAIARRERFGVWGGMSAEARLELRRAVTSSGRRAS